MRSRSLIGFAMAGLGMSCAALPFAAQAHRSDGFFTLAAGGWLKSGWVPLDGAMLSDGSVVVVGEEGAWRVTLDGRRSKIAGFAGTGVAATADGGALAIQGATSGIFSVPLGQHQILRWAPEAGVSVVAGTGARGFRGDGGPAGSAVLSLAPSRFGLSLDDFAESTNGIVARPGGGFVFTDTGNGRIRSVDAAGTIGTLAGGQVGVFRDPVGLAAIPDGGYLVTENGWPGAGGRGPTGRLLRVRPDATLETLLHDSSFVDAVVEADGTAILSTASRMWRLPPGASTPEPYLQPEQPHQPFDFAARPWPTGARFGLGSRGDLLVVGHGRLHYKPAGTTPWTLIALRGARPSRDGVAAAIETTQPGKATLEIAHADRVVARDTQVVAAGDSALHVAGALEDEWYRARVVLEGANGLRWDDEVPIHGARALTVRLARRLLGRFQGNLSDSDGSYRLGRECRRFGRRRVDCQIVIDRPRSMRGELVVGLASLRLRPSGVVLRQNYRSRRFRRHPQYDAFEEVQRLSRGYGGRWHD